jgi:Kinesin motor domain
MFFVIFLAVLLSLIRIVLLICVHVQYMIYSGKTYTMVGTSKDPGLMVLSLNTIFDLIKKDKSSDAYEVSCSYLEVYNEVKFGISPYKALKKTSYLHALDKHVFIFLFLIFETGNI